MTDPGFYNDRTYPPPGYDPRYPPPPPQPVYYPPPGRRDLWTGFAMGVGPGLVRALLGASWRVLLLVSFVLWAVAWRLAHMWQTWALLALAALTTVAVVLWRRRYVGARQS